MADNAFGIWKARSRSNCRTGSTPICISSAGCGRHGPGAGVSQERPRIRRRVHARGRPALCRGFDRRRDLLAPPGPLLDGPVAAQSRAAEPGASRRVARHLRAALPGAAEPDRDQRGAPGQVDGTNLSVVGLDCLDETPLVDIKPYFASTDSVPDAVVGWHKARRG